MTRSFPEKTFEHWCSMHLSYRYRAKLRMWWPTKGEDISVVESKVMLGKRFWLELKTMEWHQFEAKHVLSVDLRQLYEYGKNSIPDYYVFPKPAWQGVLGENLSSSWLSGLHRTDLGYQSHSLEKWFARWTWVVKGEDLRDYLKVELNKWINGKRKGPDCRIGSSSNGVFKWRTRGVGAPPGEILWHSFWSKMERCGGDGYPAEFIVNSGDVNLGSPENVGGPSGGQFGDERIASESGDGHNSSQVSGRLFTNEELKQILRKYKNEQMIEMDRAKVGDSEIYYFSPDSDTGLYQPKTFDDLSMAAEFEWPAGVSRNLVTMGPGALDI